MRSFRAHGKLLLTGEYLVLHGALALALPTRLGQTLEFEPAGEELQGAAGRLRWTALDAEGVRWFEGDFETARFDRIGAPADEVSERLTALLRAARRQNAGFLELQGPGAATGGTVTTRLEFPRDWGLGSSSTLVSLIAQWAEVDPFPLQEAVFGGSGYDVACAQAEGPVLFKRVEVGEGVVEALAGAPPPPPRSYRPVSQPTDFAPPYAEHLHFVHLGRKQDSRDAIAAFEAQAASPARLQSWLTTVLHLTMQIQHASEFEDAVKHLAKHEEVIGALLGRTPIQAERFGDFSPRLGGVIKSLGAWGGDFALVASSASPDDLRDYFASHGLTTFVPWPDMILQPPTA